MIFDLLPVVLVGDVMYGAAFFAGIAEKEGDVMEKLRERPVEYIPVTIH